MTLRARPLIHAADPYQSFDASAHELDLDGWGSKHEIFGRVLHRVDARDILEIGSWKGASAIHMAQIQQRLGRHGSEIVCVDTWLGSLEFWTTRTHGATARSTSASATRRSATLSCAMSQQWALRP